jgi:hypothetical protein
VRDAMEQPTGEVCAEQALEPTELQRSRQFGQYERATVVSLRARGLANGTPPVLAQPVADSGWCPCRVRIQSHRSSGTRLFRITAVSDLAANVAAEY